MYLFLSLFIVAALSTGECYDCTNCAVCAGIEEYDDGHNLVSIDVSDCKAGSISWVCCRSSDGESGSCTLDSCAGNAADSSKCESVVGTVKYVVPKDATEIKLQSHDGRFSGNKACASRADCCGSWSVGATQCGASSICEFSVSLDSCPTDEPECTIDADCSGYSGDCASAQCSSGKCVVTYTPGVVCRAADGVCDVAEVCQDGSRDCPADGVADTTTVCRPANLDADGTTCDATDYCDGESKTCGEDEWLTSGTICRFTDPDLGLCDPPERCSGTSAHCPDNVYKDKGYAFKCALHQYFCGPNENTAVFSEAGTCHLAAQDRTEKVYLDYPACESACIPSLCPNDRGLSNYAVVHCDPATGEWACDYKLNTDEGSCDW